MKIKGLAEILARLAWPEAAGTTPEQREALELAVRHRLAPRAVASDLGLDLWWDPPQVERDWPVR